MVRMVCVLFVAIGAMTVVGPGDTIVSAVGLALLAIAAGALAYGCCRHDTHRSGRLYL